MSPDGTKLFVTGWNLVTASNDYVTVAYDPATGSRLWIATYEGEGYGDVPSAIAVSPDGSKVFVTGTSPSVSFDEDYATVAWNASTGSQLWVQRYDGPAGGLDDSATAIAVSSDGSKVFVTGDSTASGVDHDYATLAYDAVSGVPLWVRRFDWPGADSPDGATGIAVTPDGSTVFVTGHGLGFSGNYDYDTIAYDAGSGAPLGLRRYDAQLNRDEFACCIAVTPDGSEVVVSGYGNGLGTNRDYLTVAYQV
jgi:DNA-binding beta-propeller fold protein YncE